MDKDIATTEEIVSTDWDALDKLLAEDRAETERMIALDRLEHERRLAIFTKMRSRFELMKDEDWL
jgi:hypothetical protein